MRIARVVPLLVFALGGCIVNVDFDPLGSTASMQGSWTIDGAAPTVASCGEIRFVRMRFFEGDEQRDHAGLVFDCADGAFDTRPERLVGDGRWTIAPVAIRADGSVVELGPSMDFDTGLAAGGHLVMPPFDFTGGG